MTDLELGLMIGCSVLAVVAIALAVVLIVVLNKRPVGKRAQRIKVKDGVRYSTDDVVEVGAKVNITHNEGDCVLEKGITYLAVKDSKLLPGQYTVLSTAGDEGKFNIRLGGYVREYSHGEAIVIPEGAEITPTSHAVVLR